MSPKTKSNILLIICAMIWGFAFIAQRFGMGFIGPFTFNCLRMLIGATVLIPVIFLFEKINNSKEISVAKEIGTPDEGQLTRPPIKRPLFDLKDKNLLYGGLVCGSVMGIASNFQQVGLVFSTASKTGFITTLYIVLVPIFGLVIKHKVSLNAWIGVMIAAVGLYFLCLTESFTITFGDLLVLICAGFFALHILVIDYYVARVNAVKLSCLQFFVAGVLSLVLALIFEEISWSAILQAAPAVLYVGIFSSGVAYTFQALGQRHASPTAASLILSTESVFAAIGGSIFLNEVLTGREWLGCALLFVAIIVTQIRIKR